MSRQFRAFIQLAVTPRPLVTLMIGFTMVLGGAVGHAAWGGATRPAGMHLTPLPENGSQVRSLWQVAGRMAADLGDERLVTAGLGIRTADTSSFILRSYDAHTGALIVEDEFELSVDEESAAAIEAGGGRVYAVGSGLNDSGRLSLLVRAYEARTGTLLWEDELNPYNGGAARQTALATPRRDGQSLTLASTAPVPIAQSFFVVQASDPDSGSILWQDEFLTNGRGFLPKGRGQGINFDPSAEAHFSITIKTYDPASGELLWKDEFNTLERQVEPTLDRPDSSPDIPQDNGNATSPSTGAPGTDL